jgi:hypothetical protein
VALCKTPSGNFLVAMGKGESAIHSFHSFLSFEREADKYYEERFITHAYHAKNFYVHVLRNVVIAVGM